MTPDVNVVISHSEYTVLVVDDVVSNVLLLKVLLTNEKFKVITAGNGKEALSQAVNARPDLILLDVMMPEMNGFEVAERLKADPETQHIPIIFLTALNTTADIVKGFKVGANDFISKPFNKEELGLSRFLAGIIFYTREVLLTSHYEKRLFEHASQPRVACADIRLLSYLWSRTNLSRDSYQSG